jgi:hypothetical protein
MELASLFRTDSIQFAEKIGIQIIPILDDNVKLNNILNNLCKEIYKYDMLNGTPGYIYILYNKMFDQVGEDVYKVGETIDINSRIKGYTTCYIEPVEIKYISKQLNNKSMAETMVFKKINNYRINNNREFFKCKVDIIMTAINDVESHFDTSDNIEYDDYYINLIKIDIIRILNESNHMQINFNIGYIKNNTFSPENIYNALHITSEIYNNIKTSNDMDHKLSCIKYKYIKIFNLKNEDITINFFNVWCNKMYIIKNHRRLIDQHNSDEDILLIRNMINELNLDITIINKNKSFTKIEMDKKLCDFFNKSNLFTDPNKCTLLGIRIVNKNFLSTTRKKLYCINKLLKNYGIKLQYENLKRKINIGNSIRKSKTISIYYLNYYNNINIYL